MELVNGVIHFLAGVGLATLLKCYVTKSYGG